MAKLSKSRSSSDESYGGESPEVERVDADEMDEEEIEAVTRSVGSDEEDGVGSDAGSDEDAEDGDGNEEVDEKVYVLGACDCRCELVMHF